MVDLTHGAFNWSDRDGSSSGTLRLGPDTLVSVDAREDGSYSATLWAGDLSVASDGAGAADLASAEEAACELALELVGEYLTGGFDVAPEEPACEICAGAHLTGECSDREATFDVWPARAWRDEDAPVFGVEAGRAV